MRLNNISPLLARATLELPAFMKQKISKILGLDKKTFKFHTIQTKDIFHYQKIYNDDFNFDMLSNQPLQQYRKRKLGNIYLITCFIIFFGISDFLTRLQYDQIFAYKYYVTYPIPMKYYDYFIQQLQKINQQYFWIFNVEQVDSESGFNKYRQQAKQKLFKKKQKTKISDQKKIELKTQLQNIDKLLLQTEKKISPNQD